MIDWNYIVILLCICLLVFLVYKEIKRKNTSKLLLRLLATVFAVVSLACIALPLYYNKSKSTVTDNEAVILTKGFNKDSLTQFLQNNNKIPVIFFDKNIANNTSNSHYIADVHLLSQVYKDIHTFHVFGYGFDEHDLVALPHIPVVFHPANLSSGIKAVNWNQKNKMGEPITIQGTCNNTSSAKIKIIVSSFNTTLDSAFISGNTSEAFTLTTIPKTEGRTTYILAVISGKDTIEKETIPVQVEQGVPLKIILLASSPDFDNKFLKNHLSSAGYEVAARTTISQNKYAFDYLNTSAKPLDRITSSLLDTFDIMIADAKELSHISKSELAIIQSQVAQKSMGLVVKADIASQVPFYTANFPVTAVAGDTQQNVKTFLLDTSNQLPAIIIDYPVFIKNAVNTQPIVWDKQNKIYVSSALYGTGKIAFTTLSNTYLWALSGNENAYNHFWSTLLNKVAAKPYAAESWRISPALPLVNTPVQLQLQTNAAGIPQGQVNGTPVYLKNNPDLSYQWSGFYYPVKEGWQTGIGLNGKPFYWYAYPETDWQNVYASQKIIATQQYISSHLYQTKKTNNNLTERTEFSKVYFFVLFLLCCGFLWAESKGIFSFRV